MVFLMQIHWKFPAIRWLLPTIWLLFSAFSVSAGVVHNAYYQRMVTGDFQTVSEFFSGAERQPSGRVVVRTEPEERDGLYFVLELIRPHSVAKARLLWIPTDAKEVVTVDFALPVSETTPREVFLGLTGMQTPAVGVRPLAWRIELFAVDGTLMDAHESFLWRMP